jgi:hypothetical protein
VVTGGGWEQSQPPNHCECRMTPELLFLYCLRDLEKYVRPGRCQYDYLNIARILRQLLLDRPSVTDEVNRKRKVPLEFRARLPRRKENEVNQPSCWLSFRMDSIDPDVFVAKDTDAVSLKRDQFLSVEVMYLEGRSITIKDLIRHCANQKGAVHSQQPKSDKDRVLLRTGSALRFGEIDATTRALVPVGIITLKALRPLANTVRDDLLAESKFPAALVNPMSDSDVWRDSGWGVSHGEEVDVTLELSALPKWPQCIAQGKKFQIRGEVTYFEPTSEPRIAAGKSNQ